MEFDVKFNTIEVDGEPRVVRVDAEDRWAAGAKAVELLRKEGVIDSSIPIGVFTSACSITKVERKKRLSWWEKTTAE